MRNNTHTAIPNVSTACLGPGPAPPCNCPPSPDGVQFYLPVEVTPGQWECHLALAMPNGVAPVPVPTLSEWALLGLGIALALIGLRKVGR